MPIKRYYFIATGFLSHFVVVLLLILLAKHFDLTVGQFFYRIGDKLGVSSSLVDGAVLQNSFDFPDNYHLTPRLTDDVRILSQVKQLVNNELSIDYFPKEDLKKYHPCRSKQLLAYVACGVLTKKSDAIIHAKNKILNFNIILPNASGHYANGWRLALAYDALKPLADFSEQEINVINGKLTLALKHYLILLNSNEASMWHGRTTLTSQMWLTLLAMDDAAAQSMMEYAIPHFYSMVDALSMTQAWPEGYNYWINSRAFYVVLALSGYLNGTEKDRWHEKVYNLVEKIGHWHIQATRPDWQIEPLGDEGPRVDLKDESRRVIDIIAQVTKKDIFVQYSKALKQLHGIQSYYVDYRWGWSLFYPVKLANKKSQTKHLPLTEFFGKDYFGQSYIRENWLDTATFMSFRAGNSFSHHGHYDNGHITLFKGAPLLVNSSIPGEYFGDNRLNYGIRTIAKNSVLIQRANEKVNIGFNYRNDVADGGQRITQPLGSAVTSVNDWFKKRTRSPVLAGGKILLTESNAEYSYIKADLTKAYNSTWYDDNNEQGKVELVEREILYIRTDDILLINDKVLNKAKNQVKVIFHTVNKPMVEDEVILKGSMDNGILTSNSKLIKIQNKQGYLISEIFADINDIRLIGGKDYQFYVETDGDDTVLNGENFHQGLTPEQGDKGAKWRIEINAKAKESQELVTIHRPNLNSYRGERTQMMILPNDVKAFVVSADMAVIFTDKPLNKEQLNTIKGKKTLLCGLGEKSVSACRYINDNSARVI